MSERDAAFDRALAYLGVNKIDGACVELGVHRGASLAQIAVRAPGRAVIGFDSFGGGLPEPSEHDSNQFQGGIFKSTELQVRGHFQLHGLNPDRVQLIAGWFAEQEPITEPVAFVHLDCDLYQSALDGLRLVDPVDGAVVLIDDWYCHRARPDMGVRRGWTEWLRETGRTASWFDRYGWHGSAWAAHNPGHLVDRA